MLERHKTNCSARAYVIFCDIPVGPVGRDVGFVYKFRSVPTEIASYRIYLLPFNFLNGKGLCRTFSSTVGWWYEVC
jgi:hypothetical protein